MGLRWDMVFFAGVSAVAALLFAVLVYPNADAPVQATAGDATGLRPLLANRKLLKLCWLAFLGLGVFNGLTTWLEQILAPLGIDSERAGHRRGVDHRRHRGLGDHPRAVGPDPAAQAIPHCVFSGGARHPLPALLQQPLRTLLLLAGLHGFFFLPAFALLSSTSSQLTGPARLARRRAC